MKKIYVGSAIALLLLGLLGVYVVSHSAPSSFLAREVTLYRTSINGTETNRAYLDTVFTPIPEKIRFVNVGLDLNDDGRISASEGDDNEWLVQNVMLITSDAEHLRLPLTLSDHTVGRERAVAATFFYSRTPLTNEAVAGEKTPANVSVESVTIDRVQVDDMDGRLFIDEAGNRRTGAVFRPEKIAKFEIFPIAAAQTTDDHPLYYRADHAGMPDHDQEYNECSPTSIADSFTWLAKQYGFEDLMPENIEDTVTELKADLEWDSGTLDQDILPGKQLFVDRHQLPIEVHQIGIENDQDIHYKIYEELKKGQAVELSLQFYSVQEDGTRKKAGGHMVAVTGVTGGPDLKFIRLADSATDSGEAGSGDLYQMKGNQLVDFWTDDIVEIQFVYAQSPTKEVVDGTWSQLSGEAFLVGVDHVLALGGDVITKGLSRFGFFNTFVDHPGDHFVGDRFTVIATVVRRADKKQYMFYTREDGTSQAYVHGAGTPWTLAGTMTGGGPLSPGTLVGRPSRTTITGDRYRIEQEFECVESGFAKVSYQADVTWTRDGEAPPGELATRYAEQLKTEDSFTIDSPIFRCLTTDPDKIKDKPKTTLASAVNACPGIVEDPEGQPVEVLKLADGCYPKFQFHIGGAMDPCQAEHWHAGTAVYSLTGTQRGDPNPNACGFGKVSEVEVTTVHISPDVAAQFLGGALTDTSAPSEVEDQDFDYSGYEDNGKYDPGTIQFDFKIR
ncbi:MAG: hypothetical protein AAB388_00155 [Patescibacteria group bacterium]